MAQWTVEDVCAEVADCQELLKTRNLEGAAVADFLAKVQQTLLFKLKGLGAVSTKDALKLHSSLQASSLPVGMKNVLANEVDNLVGQQPTQQCTTKMLRAQTLININLYMTKQDWDVLDSAVHPYWVKQKAVVDRLISLGIRSLAEKTVKMAVALLLCTANNVPQDSDMLYQMVQEIKTCFSTTEPNRLLGQRHLMTYPDQPQALPADVFTAAYDANDPPAGRSLPQLSHMAALAPLRSTNKKLANHHKKPQAAAAGHTLQQEAPGFDQPLPSFVRMMGMFANMFANQQGKAEVHLSKPQCNSFESMAKCFSPGTGSNESPKSSPSKVLQLEDKKPNAAAMQDQPAMESQPPAELPKTSEKQWISAVEAHADPEEELFQALKQKQLASKAKAAAKKAASKAGAKKKSQPKTVLKKPAAKTATAGHAAGCKHLPPYVPEHPTATQLASRRQCFVDKHCHKARDLATAAKLDAETCKQYGRDARAKACQVWDQHKR